MFRTADRHQIFEQALEQLLDLGPSMVSSRIDVSFFYMIGRMILISYLLSSKPRQS